MADDAVPAVSVVHPPCRLPNAQSSMPESQIFVPFMGDGFVFSQTITRVESPHSVMVERMVESWLIPQNI